MMRLESGDVYEHRVHGEVKIASVVDSYDRYDVDEAVGHEPTTIVRYGTEWDEYGLFTPLKREPIQDFIGLIEVD